jgi:hypothetical protein
MSRNRKAAPLLGALAAAVSLAVAVVTARAADDLPVMDVTSLAQQTAMTIDTPRYADSVEGPDGVGVQAKSGFRLVIIPVKLTAPRGRLQVGDLDFTAQSDDGGRYGAAAVGVNGRFSVPAEGYNVRRVSSFDEPAPATVEAAFVVPKEVTRLQLRIAKPIGNTVALP